MGGEIGREKIKKRVMREMGRKGKGREEKGREERRGGKIRSIKEGEEEKKGDEKSEEWWEGEGRRPYNLPLKL